MYCIENSRQRFVIIISFWGIVTFSPGVLLSEQMGPPILFDMGTEKSPVARGYVRVTAGDMYNASRGYGFMDEPPRSFALQAPRYDLKYRMPITEHFKNHGTALLIDGVRSRKDILCRTDIPNGEYSVTVSLGDLLQPMGSISLSANGRLIENNIALHHGLYRGIRDQGDPARPSATGFYDRIRFTIQVGQGTILIRLSGDETEYKRLMRIEERKEQPAIFMGTRKLRNQKPPYEDIGEPFKNIPLLGIEIRPHVEPPVTMPQHGKLRYTGRSEDVQEAVAAFNAGEYVKAEKALNNAGKADPLGAALACLWLMGWPPYENEQNLLPKASELLKEALTGTPGNVVAQEELEKLTIFRRALSHHLGRSDRGHSHFIENVRAYHLFRLAQIGDPLYWKSILYAARVAYMLDPNRWTATAGTGRRLMSDILGKFPDNRFAKYYVKGEFNSKTGPWAMRDYSQFCQNSPVWAAKLHETFNRLLDVSEWWIENKQKPDGSLGGGWGDDVEIVGLFGYYGFISDGASPPAVKGARNLVNGMYKNSGDIDPESGYIWHAADTEHSAEWTGDTLPMMLLIDYGSPLWIEHGLKTAKLMRDLWTARNSKGHRLFRANFTGGLNVGGGLRANDSAINMRATFPAQRVLWYSRHPGIEKLFIELTDAWLAAAMSTDKGKPRGFIPPNVAFEDGEIGGKDAPKWCQGNHARGTVNYDFGAYKNYHLDLFMLAYRLTGDEKYLEPIRLEAEAYAKMRDIEADQNAEIGSGPFLKHGLAPSAILWEKLGPELGRSRPTDEQKQTLRAMRQDVIDKCEFVIKQLQARWPVMTTEASATDRVAFPGIIHPYLIYTGGSVGRSVESLTAAVTYTGIGRDFAAFVTEPSSRALQLHLYTYRQGRVKMGIRTWDLEIGGTYEVTIAMDRDDDGNSDGPDTVTEFALEQRGQPCEVELIGQTPYIISFKQVAKGRGQKPMPDLSLWAGDIEYHAEKGYLTVRVHNTGTKEASDIRVVLYEGTSARAKVIASGTISYLAWPDNFLAQTLRLGWPYSPKSKETTFTAVIDPENKIEEICESNNSTVRTLAFDEDTLSPLRPPAEPQRGPGRRARR
jgi:hypothetical protein